jgi:subtilisin family serine protease
MLNGTSFACPQVAGLGALLFDQYPGKTWEQVRSRIITTRDAGLESSAQLSLYQLAGPVRFHQALEPGW